MSPGFPQAGHVGPLGSDRRGAGCKASRLASARCASAHTWVGRSRPASHVRPGVGVMDGHNIAAPAALQEAEGAVAAPRSNVITEQIVPVSFVRRPPREPLLSGRGALSAGLQAQVGPVPRCLQ